jgi:predicted aspartyl protease
MVDMNKFKNIFFILLITIASIAFSPTPASADVNRVEFNNFLGIILFEGEINGVEGIFLLDTGADSSIINTKVADKIGLKKIKSPLSLLGAGLIDQYETETVGFGEWYFEGDPVISFELRPIHGGDFQEKYLLTVEYQQLPMTGFDLSIIDRYLGFELMAILGGDFLEKYYLTIDYQEGYFTLSDDEPTYRSDAISIPSRVINKMVFIDAFPNNSDEAYTFLVDTGATSTVYFKHRIANKFPDYENWTCSAGWEEATFLGKLKADIYLMPMFHIGDAGIESMVTTVIDAGIMGLGLNLITGKPVHGIVGWTFLRYFRVTFDYPNQRLILEPYEHFKDRWPHLFDSVGFMIAYENYLPFVDHVLPDTPAMDAGIQVGDKLLTIDGIDVTGFDALEISEMVMGEVGSEISFVFDRYGNRVRITLKRVNLFKE